MTALPWILVVVLGVACVVRERHLQVKLRIRSLLIPQQSRVIESQRATIDDLRESQESIERQLNTTAEMCTSLMRDIDANHSEIRDLKSKLAHYQNQPAELAANVVSPADIEEMEFTARDREEIGRIMASPQKCRPCISAEHVIIEDNKPSCHDGED